MSKLQHLYALITKHYISAKRNFLSTLLELFFPIIIIFIYYILRKVIKIEYFYFSEEFPNDNFYYINNSTALSYSLNYNNYPYLGMSYICIFNPIISFIGDNFPLKLKNQILLIMNMEIGSSNSLNFSTIDDFQNYISSDDYGLNEEKPKTCFGVYFNFVNENNTYIVHLLYPAAIWSIEYNIIPNTLIKANDFFQRQIDPRSNTKYREYGYLMVMKIIYDYILKEVSKNESAEFNFVVANQKFDSYFKDDFQYSLGFMLGFCIIIAYVVPLCFNIFKLVKEKETRAKEGMKIMGMTEGIYFLSYFLRFFIFNIFYSIINSLISTLVFKHFKFIYIFLFFWLFGMNIFSLIYFFQSFMDKTRLAMLVSILCYFLMYFFSAAIQFDNVKKWIKILFSIFPQTGLQLGINVMGNFEVNKINFEYKYIGFNYRNYNIRLMYIILAIDFVLYLFLGFYLENVILHEYGTNKKWYFLCTKKYWCSTEKKNNKISNDESNLNHFKNNSQLNNEENKILNINNFYNNNPKDNKDFFQNEDIYRDYTNPKDKLIINNIHKSFDNKSVLNGVSFTLYKNEIFALLGHNGAGKSTLISILTGLYQINSGEVYYNNNNVLDDMDSFRKILGICPQHDVLFSDMTVEEHLRLFCIFKGEENIENEINKLIYDFGMEEKRKEVVENLSGGQKRKLSIMIALVGNSKIIFLDEPSSGMDITSRRNLWNILKGYTEGRIIVLTTHYMEEAAVLGKRIGIITEGNMMCLGSTLFLIEKFGKFISLNLRVNEKEKKCYDDIIDFIKNQTNFDVGLEYDGKDDKIIYEILSEEILLRIPYYKNKEKNNFVLEKFFEELDKNLEKLNIKNYSASMPTLEDVFLNVSNLKKNQKNKENNEIENSINLNENVLFDDNNYNVNFTKTEKFIIDLKISIKKRGVQIIRDTKTFFLEILCPILLTLIGLIVSYLNFVQNAPGFLCSPSEISTETQLLYYSSTDFTNQNKIPFEIIKGYDETFTNSKVEPIDLNSNIQEIFPSSVTFANDIYDLHTNSPVYYYFINFNKENSNYDFISFINTTSRQSTIIYPNFLLNNLIYYASDYNSKVMFYNTPWKLTNDEKESSKETNYAIVGFFISISFSLIPANFITIIIKERENNSKHLQIISGISLMSYWINNYLFELIKYYFIGGIGILLIFIFDFYKSYLYLLYILYGLAMVSFTYFLSFFFKTESNGQNICILINFLFGSLGGVILIILRTYEKTEKYAKIIAYVLRIIPSFCFCYGYNQLLNEYNLFYMDYYLLKGELYFFNNHKEKELLNLKYIGMDLLFLGVEGILYLFFVYLLEKNYNCCKLNYNNINNNNENNVDNNLIDSQIIKENKKSNDSEILSKNYAIVVKNLTKIFNNNFFNCFYNDDITIAVKNLSFCLEYGECFGLLGVNGAGKTTTFKCLSYEISADLGELYIDSKELKQNFSKIRSLIGYCPQFDSIFDYLTVYENLEFYSKLKGIKNEKNKEIINLLMKEMNLYYYKNIISYKLSGGNKRKLSVAIAMICNPPIILLDEPSTGMDPEARRFMWNVIHKISKRNKKSSVILTTHSMEEAETLCQRMGIMVNGEFKCLGSCNYIKEKYGYGYELNVTIKGLNEEILKEYLNEKYENYYKNNINLEINKSNYNNVLNEINKNNFEYLLNEKSFGKKLYEKIINEKNKISLFKLIGWVFYTENVLKLIKEIKIYFNEIFCIEFDDNNFVFKIKRNHNENEKTIGFLFGLTEKNKNKYYIEEYTFQQTSLEQIFNKFAKEQKNYVSKEKNIEKIEILITDDLLNKLEYK